jgi:hypothetical protein
MLPALEPVGLEFLLESFYPVGAPVSSLPGLLQGCIDTSSHFWVPEAQQHLSHVLGIPLVRYHSGGSMELNARILLLAYMVYL